MSDATVAEDIILNKVGSFGANDFKAMFDTPISIVEIPESMNMLNVRIKVHSFDFQMIYGSIPFSEGGDISLQYGDEARGRGVRVIESLSADTISEIDESETFCMVNISVRSLSDLINNKGVFLSNSGQAYTNGDSFFNYSIWYSIIVVN